jgi:hypothetical protein
MQVPHLLIFVNRCPGALRRAVGSLGNTQWPSGAPGIGPAKLSNVPAERGMRDEWREQRNQEGHRRTYEVTEP